MKVGVKKLHVQMELKNNGVELEVRTNKDEFLGDLVINKKGLTWCKGKTSKKNGKEKIWEEVIKYFEGEGYYELVGEFINKLQLILAEEVPTLDPDTASDIKAKAHHELSEILAKYKLIEQ